MAYNHPQQPYYPYYSAHQQLYYPYVYTTAPYTLPPAAGPSSSSSSGQGQTMLIDPALLSGMPARPPMPPPGSPMKPMEPPSMPFEEVEDDDDEEGAEDRFTLHPVTRPDSTDSSSSEEGGDDEDDDVVIPTAADLDFRDAESSTTAPPKDKDKDKDKERESRRRIPGPIGEVTGAPKRDDVGALSAEEIDKFMSPVKTLNHIDIDLFPSRAVFENILYTYQSNLSARKRNKALISRAAYAEIQSTLVEIKESRCRRGTAQFRFWVKKMFGLIEFYGHDVVGHQGKPVAIREDIYDILVHCHDQCDHGGRDRTVEVVKDFYRWIPKVIIGEFVKHCPGCGMKRATVKSESSKMPLYDLGGMESMDNDDDDDDEVQYVGDGPGHQAGDEDPSMKEEGEENDDPDGMDED